MAVVDQKERYRRKAALCYDIAGKMTPTKAASMVRLGDTYAALAVDPAGGRRDCHRNPRKRRHDGDTVLLVMPGMAWSAEVGVKPTARPPTIICAVARQRLHFTLGLSNDKVSIRSNGRVPCDFWCCWLGGR